MWQLLHPWWEYILRAWVIYAVVYFLLRVIGKKQIGEMSPFDLVLLLIISESVSAALTGGDDSLAAGFIVVITFVVTNYVLDVAIFKSKSLEKIMEGDPKILIKDGVVDNAVCTREKISQEELQSSLRAHGLEDVKMVHLGVLETNGKISIIKKK